MSSTILSPYRMLPANLPDVSHLDALFEFSSTGADPGALNLGGGDYSLGTDSDWNPDFHDLVIKCEIAAARELKSLFDPGGVAASDAELIIALEWTSADSGWRCLGVPLKVTKMELPDHSENISLSLELLPGTVRGAGILSVQIFMGERRDCTQKGFTSWPALRSGECFH
jgi:hypothetical protein